MVVVRHDGVGTDIERKDFCECGQAFQYPNLAIFEGVACVAVLAAQEGATDAAADAVVVGRCFQGDLLASGACHLGAPLVLERCFNPKGYRGGSASVIGPACCK